MNRPAWIPVLRDKAEHEIGKGQTHSLRRRSHAISIKTETHPFSAWKHDKRETRTSVSLPNRKELLDRFA
jgi:hypothetical protein